MKSSHMQTSKWQNLSREKFTRTSGDVGTPCHVAIPSHKSTFLVVGTCYHSIARAIDELAASQHPHHHYHHLHQHHHHHHRHHHHHQRQGTCYVRLLVSCARLTENCNSLFLWMFNLKLKGELNTEQTRNPGLWRCSVSWLLPAPF